MATKMASATKKATTTPINAPTKTCNTLKYGFFSFGSHLGFLTYIFELSILKNPYFDVLHAFVGVFMGKIVAFLDAEAILVAILDFSKCSRVRGSHPPWNVRVDPTQQ